MKTLKTILAILTLILVFSCSKDEAPQTPQVPTSVTATFLISKVTEPNSSFGTSTKFTYDASNKLTKIESNGVGNSSSSSISYNSIGKIEEVLYSYNLSLSSDKTSYLYNTQNQLIEKRNFKKNSSTFTYEYEYSIFYQYINNTIIIRRVNATSPNLTVSRSIIELDAIGNATKTIKYYGFTTLNPEGLIDNSETYTLDNKNNPYKNVPRELFIGSYLFYGQPNNVVKTDFSNSSTSRINTLEYNQDNFPVKVSNNNGTFAYEYIKI